MKVARNYPNTSPIQWTLVFLCILYNLQLNTVGRTIQTGKAKFYLYTLGFPMLLNMNSKNQNRTLISSGKEVEIRIRYSYMR